MPLLNHWMHESEKEFKKDSIYNNQVVSLLEFIKIASKTIKKDIKINPGFYPYRKNEIMKVRPSYEILIGWKPKTNLEEGLARKWTQEIC